MLWDCWGDGGWKVNEFIPLHHRVQTLSLSEFKFKMSLEKRICQISEYNF